MPETQGQATGTRAETEFDLRELQGDLLAHVNFWDDLRKETLPLPDKVVRNAVHSALVACLADVLAQVASYNLTREP